METLSKYRLEMCKSLFLTARRYAIRQAILPLMDTDTIFDKAITAGAYILDMTMGKKAVYIRGNVQRYIHVSNGGLNWRNITTFGDAAFEQTQQDFIISRNHSKNPFPYSEPVQGDRIRFANGFEWELLKIDGQECWRPMGKSLIRVHCKRIK